MAKKPAKKKIVKKTTKKGGVKNKIVKKKLNGIKKVRVRRVTKPTLLTEAMRKKIVGYMNNGVKGFRAAIVAGVSERTYYNWIQKGLDEPNGKYGTFVKETIAASEKYMIFLQSHVNRHIVLDGNLALKMMGKERPKEYGDKSQLEITGAEGGPVQINLTNEEAEAILAKLPAKLYSDYVEESID